MRIEFAPRITGDPQVCFGKPVIAGTRVPVEIVLGDLGGGMSIDAVADAYAIACEDVLAALTYASRLVAKKRVKATA